MGFVLLIFGNWKFTLFCSFMDHACSHLSACPRLCRSRYNIIQLPAGIFLQCVLYRKMCMIHLHSFLPLFKHYIISIVFTWHIHRNVANHSICPQAVLHKVFHCVEYRLRLLCKVHTRRSDSTPYSIHIKVQSA